MIPSVWETVRRAREAGDPQCLVSVVPYSRFVGFEAYLEDGELRGMLRYSESLVGNPMLPALHGGTVGALLESTAIFRLLWEAQSERLPKTINITVAYLRSARPEDTHARAEIVRHGRRVASVRCRAWQRDADRLIATADAHFLLTPAEAR